MADWLLANKLKIARCDEKFPSLVDLFASASSLLTLPIPQVINVVIKVWANIIRTRAWFGTLGQGISEYLFVGDFLGRLELRAGWQANWEAKRYYYLKPRCCTNFLHLAHHKWHKSLAAMRWL